MNRRSVVAGLAVGCLAPRLVSAQPPRRLARVGIMSLGMTGDQVGPTPRYAPTAALLRGLRDLGYVYGETFVTEVRGGDGRPDRFGSLAEDMIRSKVDVVVAPGPMLTALKKATATVAVVMAGALDPVAEGLIKSLAAPGGNFTGFSLQSADTVAKRLELLKTIAPGATVVAVLWEQTVLSHWRMAEAVARERGWKLLPVEVDEVADIEGAVRAAVEGRAGALLVLGGGVLFPHSRRIAELAVKHRLPAMYSLRPQAEAGGLCSYGADIVDTWRRAAVFVDKLLRGASPATLPVEQPSSFELVINMGAARAIGLTIPQSVLFRAEIIQ